MASNTIRNIETTHRAELAKTASAGQGQIGFNRTQLLAKRLNKSYVGAGTNLNNGPQTHNSGKGTKRSSRIKDLKIMTPQKGKQGGLLRQSQIRGLTPNQGQPKGGMFKSRSPSRILRQSGVLFSPPRKEGLSPYQQFDDDSIYINKNPDESLLMNSTEEINSFAIWMAKMEAGDADAFIEFLKTELFRVLEREEKLNIELKNVMIHEGIELTNKIHNLSLQQQDAIPVITMWEMKVEDLESRLYDLIKTNKELDKVHLLTNIKMFIGCTHKRVDHNSALSSNETDKKYK